MMHGQTKIRFVEQNVWNEQNWSYRAVLGNVHWLLSVQQSLYSY